MSERVDNIKAELEGLIQGIEDSIRKVSELDEQLSQDNQVYSGPLEAAVKEAWQVVVNLKQQQCLNQSRFAEDETERIWALNQLSLTGDETVLSALEQIIKEEQALQVRAAAENAKSMIQDKIKLAQREEQLKLREQVTNEQLVEIKQKLDDTQQALETTLFGPKLENYEGYLCAQFVDGAGAALPYLTDVSPEPNEQRWPDKSPCRLKVWLQPEPIEGIVCNEVEITDGQDAPRVQFQVMLDVEGLQFERSKPQENRLEALSTTGKAQPVFFAVREVNATNAANVGDVWVQLFQKNRLIQTVSCKLRA